MTIIVKISNRNWENFSISVNSHNLPIEDKKEMPEGISVTSK
jgi:hypothetical protein